MIKYDEGHFRRVCESSISMADAARQLGLHFNTFKSHAEKLGCYNPNQGLKGGSRGRYSRIPTEDILNGKHPNFQTYKLKLRLFEEGYKEKQCEECNVEEWNGERLPFELNHIDGNRHNHSLDNLEILCPNCHSQTDTWRARNKK